MPSTVHVLIVDDSPADREAIRRALRHETEFRYRFTEAESGDEAFRAVANETPDLMIVDFCLPGIDGLEIARRIRGDARLTPFPIVLLTGTLTHPEIPAERAMDCGVQDLFNKNTISPDLLPRVARNAMDRYRLMQRLVQSENEANAARLRADDANRAKSMFLASMSHELRTPLTAVLGLTEVLLESPEAPDARQMLEMIRTNGLHLADLLNDLLDLARIEAGGIEIDVAECDPRKLIEDLCGLLRFRARDHGLSLELVFVGELPPRIRTDAIRVRQILMNLLSNAIKFTRKGGVTVTVELLKRASESTLRISVADTGIGIDADHLSRIFDPFVQVARDERTSARGVGLGLAISRALARALGGDLLATSAPGSGSAFVATVAVEPVEATGETETVDGASRNRFLPRVDGAAHRWPGKRILVAEDTPANRFLIRRLLQPTGAELAFAEDGGQAIAQVATATSSQPFDLILMDMQMPGLDGFEATAELRRRGVRSPVVALTAAAMEGDRERCLHAGCTDYLVKPIDRETLLTTLSSYLVDDA